jgi:hypothetical protein
MGLTTVFDGLLMEELFDFVEVQQGEKTAHFEVLNEESKVPYSEVRL